VLAVIATGDSDAAFAFGRYGIAGVVEARAQGELGARVSRLGPRAEHELPTVALGRRHAPETLAWLAHYVRTLGAAAGESTVFADVATIIDVLVAEDLTCQTNLATKAGATHDGQFIGSFEFYRELRRTRYGRIPDHPDGAIEMDVFVALDEVLHEVIHLLYLANRMRAGLEARHHRIGEEFSATWWQAVVHARVFPDWLADRHILEINDDFMLCERNAERSEFWTVGYVFDQFVDYPWVPYVLARLPARASYVGERPDLAELVATFPARPEAAFLVPSARERLAVPVAFDSYPPTPTALRVGSR
jgi:hypothetical protein